MVLRKNYYENLPTQNLEDPKKLTKVSWKQFNELLLLCNKDRVSKGFFDLFFKELLDIPEGQFTPIGKIEHGVKKFRECAMLGFGNFRFAYRILSKLSKDEIKNKKELKVYLTTPELCDRPTKIQKIEPINEEDTYLVGYFSSKVIGIDLWTAALLSEAFEKYTGSNDRHTILDYVQDYANKKKKDVPKDIREEVLNSITRVTENYFSNNSSNTVIDFKRYINEILSNLEPLEKRRKEILQIAERNSDIYLTWDDMDVYIATSMREQWEYRSIYRFVKNLFNNIHLNDLKLKIRYFDPTQSYEKSRVDKGLIEGLMLKRAKCTIYLVQETDTFGKDSELAATLAQGKPVIAYVPKITDDNISEHLEIIKKESSRSLEFLRDKLWLLSKSFRKIEVQKECIKNNMAIKAKIADPIKLRKFIIEFEQKITDHLNEKVWSSIETIWVKDEDFIKSNHDNFELICTFVGIADKHFYDHRAFILKNHPLGIQINLNNGVANGVLVVRNIVDCAKLLYNLIKNKAKFKLDHNDEKGYWYLEEDISKCAYRVVTDDLKVTNSFWNFYLMD